MSAKEAPSQRLQEEHNGPSAGQTHSNLHFFLKSLFDGSLRSLSRREWRKPEVGLHAGSSQVGMQQMQCLLEMSSRGSGHWGGRSEVSWRQKAPLIAEMYRASKLVVGIKAMSMEHEVRSQSAMHVDTWGTSAVPWEMKRTLCSGGSAGPAHRWPEQQPVVDCVWGQRWRVTCPSRRAAKPRQGGLEMWIKQ
jgi:hypothetical protein